MPYNPQISYDTTSIANGISQAGQAWANVLPMIGQNFAQQRKEAKAADALRDAMKGPDDPETGQPSNPNPFGLSDDAWHSLSWRDKSARAQGYMKATALQSAMQEQQLKQAEINRYNTQAAAEGGDARLLQALDQQVNVPLDPLTGTPATDDPNAAKLAGSLTPIQRAVIHAGAQMGPTQRGSAAAIYRQILPQIMGGDDNGGGVNFTEDPVTGQRFATHGKILESSGLNPSKLTGAVNTQAQPVTAPDGSLQGYNIPTGNSRAPFKFTAVKDLNDQQKGQLTLGHQKAIDGLITQLANPLLKDQPQAIAAINDQIGQHRAAISGLQGKAPKGGQPAAGTGKPSPADITYLQQHPELAPAFEAKFGKGSADAYLP
jgi:hypothetical protein